MKTFLITLFILFGGISFAQTKDFKPDSTIFRYLISEYQKQLNINKKYEDVPVIKEYIGQMNQTQKLIDLIQEEQKKLQPKEKK